MAKQTEEQQKKDFEAFQKFQKDKNKIVKQAHAVETSNFAEYIKQAKEKAILNSKQLQANEDARNLAKEIHEIHKEQLGTLNAISNTDKEIVDLEQDILRNGTLREDQLKTYSKADKDHWKAMLQEAKEQVKQAKLLKKSLHTKLEIQKIEEKALPHLKKLAKAQKELNKQHDKYGQSVEQSLGFLDGIDDALNDIPIVGGILSKALGLDDIKEKLSKSLIDAFNPAASSQKKQSEEALNGYSNQIDRLNEVEGAASNVTKEMGGIAPELEAGAAGAAEMEAGLIAGEGAATGMMAAMGPLGWIALAIGAIVVAFTAFKKLAYEVDKTQVDIANNLSISKDAAIDLNQTLNDQNVLWKDQVRITGYLSTTYGTFSSALAKDIPRLRDLQHNLQLSDENMSGISVAANLLGSSFEGTVDKASEFETTVINSTKELYNQAGVNIDNAELMVETKETLKDIGGISKINLALYGKSGAALVKQVTTVRKLGLSFEGISKTMDTVLDFESSIESEMKANVLLGKNMNLNAVREASLRGDVAQVAIEINKVMEDQNINLETFNDMMPFQKKALAASLGMQADEVQMMLLKNKIGDKALIAGIKSGETTKEQLIATGELTEEQAASLIIAERKTTVEQDMAEIQDQLSQTLKANMPGVQAFLGAMADFGLEVQDAGGFGGYLMGKGRSAAEIKHDDEIKAAGAEVTSIDKQIAGAKTKEEKDKLQEEKGAALAKGETAAGMKHEEANIDETTYASRTALYAGAGAAIGSIFPGIGTAIGAGIGALAGLTVSAFQDVNEEMTDTNDRLIATGKALPKAAEVKQSTGDTSLNSEMFDDALIRPGQKPIRFNKGDIIMAGTNLLDPAEPMAENKDTSISGKLGELINSIVTPIENLVSGPSTPTESSEVVALLKELIKKIDQPVQFNIGGKTIQEIDKVISVNRSYTSKENGYGT
jgi:hypothetical protein